MNNLDLTVGKGIATITFDRRGSSANLLDHGVLVELAEILRQVRDDTSIRGLVIRSAKPSIFIAGADLKVLSAAKGKELDELITLGQETFNLLADLPITTVAAIHGACVGGGCELALACDWRIASDSKTTRIGLPETQLGILPAWGGSTRLPSLIGLNRALPLILGGKLLSARSTLHAGIVDAVIPEQYLGAFAEGSIAKGKRVRKKRWVMHHPASVAWMRDRAEKALLKRTRGNYPGPQEALKVVAQSVLRPRSVSLNAEREAIMGLAGRPETSELIRLHFLQERAKKRRIGSAEPVKAESVAVIGAGVMGSGIAYWLSSRGLPVLMMDIHADALAKGLNEIRNSYHEAVKRRSLSRIEAQRGIDRVHGSTALVPLDRRGLVIEAATEDLSIKKRIFRDLSLRSSPDTLLATNTSALPVGELADMIDHPGRLLGLHFFNPVHRMPLVEVVRTSVTSDETLASGVAFVRSIGKVPVVVKDSPGFLVNRILMPYLVEAARMFDEGGDPIAIDGAMLDFGMPMGPLRLLDEVGLDVAIHVARTLGEAFPKRMRIPEIVAKLASKGQLGRKSGKGFYSYPKHEKNDPRLNPDALALRTVRKSTPTDLQSLLADLMTREAERCLDEGIADSADDIDLAMVLGTGYAPFRGGPLQYGKESK